MIKLNKLNEINAIVSSYLMAWTNEIKAIVSSCLMAWTNASLKENANGYWISVRWFAQNKYFPSRKAPSKNLNYKWYLKELKVSIFFKFAIFIEFLKMQLKKMQKNKNKNLIVYRRIFIEITIFDTIFIVKLCKIPNKNMKKFIEKVIE